MKNTIARMLSVSLSAMIVLSILVVQPAFSGFPPRSYNGPGLGYGTFYVSPQDSLFTGGVNGTWFKIQVRMENFTHIYSWQYMMVFKNDLLWLDPMNVTEVPGTDYIFSGKSRTSLSVVVDAYNATHTRLLAFQSLQGVVAPAAGTDKGLTDVWLQIIKDPGVSETLSTKLYFQTDMSGATDDTFTIDEGGSLENDCTMKDGYYENAYVAPPAANLEITPTLVTMPAIEGDRVLGTSRAIFSVDIHIHNVNPLDEMFFIQLNLSYDGTLLTCLNVTQGTFMKSDPDWAPHGLTDNSTQVDPGMAYWWIMIDPNATGYWDNTEWPSGGGLLATAWFEITGQHPDDDGMAPASIHSSDLTLQGVFGEFFLGHPNDVDPPYLPYSDPVNGAVNVYDYYWRDPVAQKTHLPDQPLVDQVVTFDGSTSYGYRNILAVMTPQTAYIADYEWDFGDGSDFEYGAIVTHAYPAMGDYNVTLTVYDLDGRTHTVWQIVTVVFGRLIDVYIGTGTGAYPAPYGGQGQNNPADMFEPQKTVCVYANVTYNGDPVQSKLVTFIILSPHGLHDFSRSAITDSNGQAYIEFGLPWPCVDPVNEIFGIWNITVKVDIRSVVVEDIVPFKVWWLIETTCVVPKETSFVKGEYACFDITFRTLRWQPIDGVLEITLYDDLGVPFAAARIEYEGIGWNRTNWCQWKEYNVTICLPVPKWAFVGTGTAYVNFFHHDITNPYHMGSPYCPEVTCTFGIVKYTI